MKDLSSRIGKGSLWISATRAAANALGALSTILLARLLVPEDFGLVAIGATLLAIVTAITDIAMSQALVHHPNPTDEHMHTAWTLGVLRSVLIGVLFGLSGPLVVDLYGDERLLGVMVALGFSLALSGLANPRRVMLQRDLVFWQDFLLVVAQKLVTVIVSVLIALYYRSYWALLLGTLAGQIAQVAISYTAMPFLPRISFRHGRELWSFSIWLTLAQVVKTINLRIDHLLIGKFFSPADLGHFTVGENLATLPTRETTQPLTNTLFPAFARLRDDPPRLARAYQRAQATVTAIALPLGFGFALIAEPLVRVAMGEKWMAAVPIIEALAAIFALQTLASIAYSLALAFGQTQLLFRREAQLLALRLPVLIGLMLAFGLVGVLIARAFTLFITIFFNLQIVKRLIGLSFRVQLGANVRALASVSAMVLAVKLLHWNWRGGEGTTADLLLAGGSIALGGVVYLGTTTALWLLRGKPEGPESEAARLLQRIFKQGTLK